jgi:nucleoid-associated protein YgaU
MPVQSDDELAKKVTEAQKQQELAARAREIKAEQDERLEEAKQKIRERREAGKAEAKTYTVQAGDTLGKIAQKVYNDAGRWKEIFEANKETNKNPDLIQVGQQLKIP